MVTILFFTCFSVNCSVLFKVTIKAQLDSSQHAQAETKILFRLQYRGQRGVRDCRTTMYALGVFKNCLIIHSALTCYHRNKLKPGLPKINWKEKSERSNLFLLGPFSFFFAI